MNLSLPIYVEHTRDPAHQRDTSRARMVYCCQPLFFPGMQAGADYPGLQGRDESLSKAMSKLLKRLKPHVDSLAAESRHHQLAEFAFNPAAEASVQKLQLDLREQIVRPKLLFVQMQLLDRRIAFTPSIPDVWFEVDDQASLKERAGEVLTAHFREQTRLHRDSRETLSVPTLEGQAWVTELDLFVSGGQAVRQEMEDKFAALFDDSKMHGSTELRRVGRCLDWLYPEDLQRAVLREREVDELTRLLGADDRRPVLLVGPSAVGKTSVLHEFVFRRVEGRKRIHSAKKNIWLLSPQRLISGMSYVGQWENRVLAILKESRRRDHVLYFDDVMGLYQAGISASSRLCVADVLRSHVMRREVRVVGELTAAALAALQERDRGLADQFHVIPIQPTSEEETLRVLLQARRQLEAAHGCRFDPGAVPSALEITRRYEREAAFPGKAVSLLQHVAAKCPDREITRDVIYDEFQAKTGLSRALLDPRHRMTRNGAKSRVRDRLVGQEEAVDAVADVVMVAKAGLNDPSRPLATLLFLGPTGVGKTECAKVLASTLFTDESRLLRFDMNEFVSPFSAARLIGTLDEPQGLLTAAVRQQPYAVVLLDEIEKAHPDVFDLLLQVTGEGRLTDSLGRTSDFSNCVIVMTSNLGVREASRTMGLQTDDRGRQQSFVKAAERFFRPEFFNRIDRVIPFDTLRREEMQRIAELQLGSVLRREGLVRRRCALDVDPRAMEQIISQGYHPQLGARALKRSLEQQLTQPVAARLAEASPETPTVIRVYQGAAGVLSDVQPLEPVDRVAAQDHIQPADWVRRSKALAHDLATQVEANHPGQIIATDHLDAAQLRYFAIKEQIHVVQELAAQLNDRLADVSRGAIRPEIGTSVRDHSLRIVKSLNWYNHGSKRRLLQETQAADDIDDFVRETQDVAASSSSELDRLFLELRRQANWLWAMWRAQARPERLLFILRGLEGADDSAVKRLFAQYVFLYQLELSFEVRTLECDRRGWKVGVLSGSFISPLAEAEVGVHLIRHVSEQFSPVQVMVRPAGEGSDEEALEKFFQERETWIRLLARGEATLEDDPTPLGHVIRSYESDGSSIDMRSGTSVDGWPGNEVLAAMILDGLAPPPWQELA